MSLLVRASTCRAGGCFHSAIVESVRLDSSTREAPSLVETPGEISRVKIYDGVSFGSRDLV